MTKLKSGSTFLYDDTSGDIVGIRDVDGGDFLWVSINPVVNGRAYGAIGDGVTDDTAAINAALSAGAGKVVYLPAGTYLISDALQIQSNTWFRGDGVATIIKSVTLVSGGVGEGHRQLVATSKTGFRITDMQFDTSGLTGVVNGVRCLSFLTCTHFSVERCKFVTGGAATACRGSSHYRIADNTISCESPVSGLAQHDGIIDQWEGSNNFSVVGNTVLGNTLGRYLILVTGESTAGAAAACHNFVIANNRLYSAAFVGIWINGREGVNYNFEIIGNTVDTVRDFFCIGIADSYAFTVADNVLRRPAGSALHLYKETTGGGISSAVNGTISGNVIYDANTALSASASVGSAIVVDDECTGLTFSGNRVKGSTHVHAIWFDTTTFGNEVLGYSLDAGTAGIIQNTVASNTVPGGSTYTPTLTAVANVTSSAAYACRFERFGNVVTVTGRVDVTPAVNTTATTLGISLPIASNLAVAATDLAGVANSGFAVHGAVTADITNDRAQLQFNSTNITLNAFYFSFQYAVK